MTGSAPAEALLDAEFTHYLTQLVGEELDAALLQRAVTHRSYAYEHGGVPHNERLEFLGDSVLGLVITDHLYTVHPDVSEGQLAKLRASVVNMRALASVSRTLGVGQHLLLGKGEDATGGRDKDSILADSLEAILGAIYLSVGMPGTARLIHHVFDPLMALSATLGAALDWKTSLQEASSQAGLGVPCYRVTETGPDHAKEFTAEAVLTGEVFGVGVGTTKKIAEQAAAEQAWTKVSQQLAPVSVSATPTV